VESTYRLRTSFEPGQQLPLLREASARVLLASMSEQTRQEYLAPLARWDPPAAAGLARPVAATQRDGWAVSEEEIDEGIFGVSAAVRDSTGIVAALTMPSPLIRVPAGRRDQLLRKVLAAAGEINEALLAAHR
jgi:DNA-binding IclR family transcriptional regulator